MAEFVSYPKVPLTAWRTLRAKAATAPSTRFTASGVAALLGMSSPNSARDNVISAMRKIGLFNDEGTLTDRGNKWRIDSTYAEACQEILDEIYPEELLSLTGESGMPDKGQLSIWFQHKGHGESNARQMANTYAMIAEKQPQDAPASTPGPSGQSVKKTRAPRALKERLSDPPSGNQASRSTQSSSADESRVSNEGRKAGPTIHLDIQIHIPATANAEQIDQIFASMAKHLT